MQGEKAEEALAAGATIVGAEDLVKVKLKSIFVRKSVKVCSLSPSLFSDNPSGRAQLRHLHRHTRYDGTGEKSRGFW